MCIGLADYVARFCPLNEHGAPWHAAGSIIMLYIFTIGGIWFGFIFLAFHATSIRYGHNQNWIMKRPQCVKCHLYWSLRTIINIPFVESKDSATIQLNVAFYSRLDGMCQNIKCSLTFIISFLTKFTELQFGLESQNSNRELNWMKSTVRFTIGKSCANDEPKLMLFLKFIFSWFYCDMRSTSD